MRRLAGIAGQILLGIAALLVAAVAWAFITGNSRYQERWTAHVASFPIPSPVAGADSGAGLAQAIACGKHLVARRTQTQGAALSPPVPHEARA